ncbi:hypothetical protein DCAR_0520825 [Daucus carota subsp. sativus]|uniref:Uncharacterized protein n=1 Tax=Daucus carota subsp. sativus TaxID=79200 RepID=A0A164YTW4_DAUCS|nr:hypothetical protein DCAR_0520825 [Daucus carota subsp. sativus]
MVHSGLCIGWTQQMPFDRAQSVSMCLLSAQQIFQENVAMI